MSNARGKRKEILPVDEKARLSIENMETEETTEQVTEETIEPVTEETTETKGIVICQNLNVRKAPAIDSSILQIITKDTIIKILSDVNDTWYEVSVGEIEKGFCMKKFIKISE